MSDQFERFEQDLIEIIKSAKIKLADEIPISDKEPRRILIRQVTKEIDDMNAIVGDMEFYMSKTGPNSRGSMANKIKKYKFDIELVQKELKKALSDSQKKPYDSNLSFNQDPNDPERKKALQIHNSIKNAGDSLARSTQIAIETEQIGTSVLGELNEQGEQLRRTNDRLDDTSAAVSKSRKLINKLSKGIFYNKLLMFIIVFLEICILGGVIYWKFFSK